MAREKYPLPQPGRHFCRFLIAVHHRYLIVSQLGQIALIADIGNGQGTAGRHCIAADIDRIRMAGIYEQTYFSELDNIYNENYWIRTTPPGTAEPSQANIVS